MRPHLRRCLLRWGFRLACIFHTRRPGRTSGIAFIAGAACLFATWRLAGLECIRLSTHLRHRRFQQSLASFERACVLVVITDALVDEVGQHSSDAPLAAGRGQLLAAIERWLEEARRELPKVASCLCSATAVDEEIGARLEGWRVFISQAN
jgi:hypothetical protein